MTITKVAVLDDYQGISESSFSKLDKSVYDVAIFKDTLLPFNHPKTPQSEKDRLVKRLEPFSIICTMRERTPFPAELVDRLPNLELLLTTGKRNLGLDLEAFKRRQIPVAGAIERGGKPGGPDSTTQHFITALLSVARNIAADDLSVKTGGWQTGAAFNLSGKVYGSIGLGRLGASTAKILQQSFNTKVIAWSPNLTQEKADAKAAEVGLPVHTVDGEKTFQVVSREELFRTADIVAVHVVLSDRSRGMITKQDLGLMKKNSIFINTSRGPIVVEEDLLQTLRQGKIGRAAIDVFEIEPLPADSPWRSTDWGRNGSSQVLLTPHMGYVETETLDRWYQQQVENILRWEKGEDLHTLLA